MTMSYPQQQAYPQPHPMPPARPAPKSKRWPWILGLIGTFLLGLIIGLASNPNANKSNAGDATASAPASGGAAPSQAAPPPQQPAGPATTMGNGTYQVGVDVQPGQYKTSGPKGNLPCYWARRKDDSGSFDAIVANGNPEGPTSLTINQGEFLELSGDCDWAKVG